jgi:hypothetical protein
MFLPGVSAAFLFFVAAASSGLAAGRPADALIREERSVLVDGVAELWRLEWRSPPKAVCGPEGGWDDWGMCPCAGFIFGEAGQLDLVRLRPGTPEDRLHLTPLFGAFETPAPGAVLRRWPEFKGDTDRSEEDGFAKSVRARSLAPLMELADYDHDGRATEFVLQVGAGPCGHRQAVVVGIDVRNPRLHALGTAERPDRPIVLQTPAAWESFRASRGQVEIEEWRCGDHGTEEEETVVLQADAKGIHAKRTKKKCED